MNMRGGPPLNLFKTILKKWFQLQLQRLSERWMSTTSKFALSWSMVSEKLMYRNWEGKRRCKLLKPRIWTCWPVSVDIVQPQLNVHHIVDYEYEPYELHWYYLDYLKPTIGLRIISFRKWFERFDGSCTTGFGLWKWYCTHEYFRIRSETVSWTVMDSNHALRCWKFRRSISCCTDTTKEEEALKQLELD